MEEESVIMKLNLHYLYLLVIISVLLVNCTPTKKIYKDAPTDNTSQAKSIEVKRTLPLKTTDSLQYLIENSDQLKNHFVGFVLHDPTISKDILNINGSRPFTPASNMKLYTLLTSLNYLDDNVTALEYLESEDSLIIRGTGDPSFLDPYQKDNETVMNFLSETSKKIFLDLSTFRDERYGNGWAWDDYPYYYQAEKSAFPIYANKLYLRKSAEDSLLSIRPKLLERYIKITADSTTASISRAPNSNSLTINNEKLEGRKIEWDMPFVQSEELLIELLSDTINKNIYILDQPKANPDFKALKGIATDSLLQELMIISDNFIAEQLLLMCSQEKFGYMHTKELINLAKTEIFEGMPDEIKWVDGSGLSRYNLVTPNTNIWVLNRILEHWDLEKIKSYFPTGKGNDTLDESFKYEKPWIFAKTGSLSNNFNLSGYLVTKSNRVLLFSFMNNHYMNKKSEVIKEMNEILSFVRDNY